MSSQETSAQGSANIAHTAVILMFIPPTPPNPDEHLRYVQTEQEQHASIAESRRKLGLGGMSSLSMGDIFIMGGTTVAAVLVIVLLFLF